MNADVLSSDFSSHWPGCCWRSGVTIVKTCKSHGAHDLHPIHDFASLPFLGLVHDEQAPGGIGAPAVIRWLGSAVFGSKSSFGRSRVETSPVVPSSYVSLNENGSVGESVQSPRPARENACPEMKLHAGVTLA